MKRSKPTNSKPISRLSLRKVSTAAQLRDVQRAMADAIFQPLTSRWRMQKPKGKKVATAEDFIKPNDRLSSFDRLEIYNRQYWFRLLDCLYEDYPGLLAVVGPRKFLKLATAYLGRHPSDTFALRDLGGKLEEFLRSEPQWSAPREALALDMVRFEWAQVVAFDAGRKPPLSPDDILDQPADRLRVGLQPYLSLLELDYAVDEFLIALKERESGGLRGEASNAVECAPKQTGAGKRIAPPRREKVYLAVHRHENMLYYKRLAPEAFVLLTALAKGATIEKACLKAVATASDAEIDWTVKIQKWFANWSALGWLCCRN